MPFYHHEKIVDQFIKLYYEDHKDPKSLESLAGFDLRAITAFSPRPSRSADQFAFVVASVLKIEKLLIGTFDEVTLNAIDTYSAFSDETGRLNEGGLDIDHYRSHISVGLSQVINTLAARGLVSCYPANILKIKSQCELKKASNQLQEMTEEHSRNGSRLLESRSFDDLILLFEKMKKVDNAITTATQLDGIYHQMPGVDRTQEKRASASLAAFSAQVAEIKREIDSLHNSLITDCRNRLENPFELLHESSSLQSLASSSSSFSDVGIDVSSSLSPRGAASFFNESQTQNTLRSKFSSLATEIMQGLDAEDFMPLFDTYSLIETIESLTGKLSSLSSVSGCDKRIAFAAIQEQYQRLFDSQVLSSDDAIAEFTGLQSNLIDFLKEDIFCSDDQIQCLSAIKQQLEPLLEKQLSVHLSTAAEEASLRSASLLTFNN